MTQEQEEASSRSRSLRRRRQGRRQGAGWLERDQQEEEEKAAAWRGSLYHEMSRLQKPDRRQGQRTQRTGMQQLSTSLRYERVADVREGKDANRMKTAPPSGAAAVCICSDVFPSSSVLSTVACAPSHFSDCPSAPPLLPLLQVREGCKAGACEGEREEERKG
eukprot:764047-Hanusia_phi.AAC.2